MKINVLKVMDENESKQNSIRINIIFEHIRNIGERLRVLEPLISNKGNDTLIIPFLTSELKFNLVINNFQNK